MSPLIQIQMARVNNSGTIKRILDDGGIQTSVDEPPHQLAGKIVPVLISNPQRHCNIVRNVTSGTTMYTTPTTGDFYLVSAYVGAVDTGAYSSNTISVVIDGKTQIIASTGALQTVGGNTSGTCNVNLSVPLKIDRGSVITSTKGSSNGEFGIVGYVVEKSGV